MTSLMDLIPHYTAYGYVLEKLLASVEVLKVVAPNAVHHLDMRKFLLPCYGEYDIQLNGIGAYSTPWNISSTTTNFTISMAASSASWQRNNLIPTRCARRKMQHRDAYREFPLFSYLKLLEKNTMWDLVG
ncbi:hypothetical protein BU16DRAFT_525384 [Lophium mytilinum]|uniref:Uncharacterized protein n=1 Tax=Lophium mytilinum TaxID=390894 RepID=A0A6A6QZA3_9PEZI|nr:hypothetical protein BU16DRAFT_525384 [Lophium mytilinum]